MEGLEKEDLREDAEGGEGLEGAGATGRATVPHFGGGRGEVRWEEVEG